MSRITRWKLEKTKVKVVFRLQFHATHIPQTGWDKLFISFIPVDSGKATAKTTKSNVRNGTCKWADPIYETTRLLQDIKTKLYDEKLYKFIVSMGSSRSSILGEATINLADFSDALKPSAISLPLVGCEAGATLHVTVQLLTSKTGFREFEQQRELRERGFQATSDHGIHDELADGKVSSSEKAINDHLNKVSARIKFKRESKWPSRLPLHEEEVAGNEQYTDSGVGFDGSSNTSDSMYAEKLDTSSTHEVESLKSTISGDLGGISFSQSNQPDKGDAVDEQFSIQATGDWVNCWDSICSTVNDTAACDENSSHRGSLEMAKSSILDLKTVVNSLQSHADELGVETDRFAQQLAAEISSGQELAKDVAGLKSECVKFRDDLEQLRSYKLSFVSASQESIPTDRENLLKNLQLQWLEGLVVMEDKIRDLQNKVHIGYHERDFRFLSSDLQVIVDVLQNLKQEVGVVISGNIVANAEACKNRHMTQQFVTEMVSSAEPFQPEEISHCLGVPALVSHESNSLDSTTALNGKVVELLRELNESNTEREALARKMDQMECYYEALVQELEQNQRQMMGELQNLQNEHSACLYTISSGKNEIEKMQQDMNKQVIKFAEEKHILDSLNSEFERRATRAEGALKRAQLNYSIAVNQLQKDLDLLSCQVVSMHETNENLIKQTFSDILVPSLGSYPDIEKIQKPDTEESLSADLLQIQNQNDRLKRQHIIGENLLKGFNTSLNHQEGLHHIVEEDAYELHLVNMYLDVFSKALHVTLLEASSDIIIMKEKTNQLSQQLNHTTESKELLTLRLQNAMDEIQSLTEYKTICIEKSNDLAQQNQVLEANVNNMIHENYLLTQKINDYEAFAMECGSYKHKYEAFNLENVKLANILKKDSMENEHLHNEISVLQEELKTVRTEIDQLRPMKDKLQRIMDFVSDKLLNMLLSYDKKYSELSLWIKPVCLDIESKDIAGVILQLEEIQQRSCAVIYELREEKKDLLGEKHQIQVSFSKVESDFLIMKQKFERDLQDIVNNLCMSDNLLQKLQSEFETIARRVEASFDAENIYTQKHNELLSDLDHLEAQLQQVTSRNEDLAQQILAFNNLFMDAETFKLRIAVIEDEKEALAVSLQEKIEEFSTIELELKSLKEILHSLHDELESERSSKAKLETAVADLTSQLNEKKCQLQDYDQQGRELVHLKQLVSDLELEKLRVSHLLLQSEERLKDVLAENSSITCLDNQLSNMYEFSIATDISLTFARTQYGFCIKQLTEELHSKKGELNVIKEKHCNVEHELNGCISREAHYIEENGRLMKSLDSLKSDLEASSNQNRMLLDQISTMTAELEEYKQKSEIIEATLRENQQAHELERLEHLMMISNEEFEDLLFSKEENEVKILVLQCKLTELHALMMSLKQQDDELLMLQNQCKELSRKLSEQMLKTEEYKNLSIHLKELKDKADAECFGAHERRETEGPPVVMQESLRIAFIKEQYESKLQDLKHQISVSKKHSEEMLWKLQDAVDEIENRKKSEALHIKRSEELAMKISELEYELNSALSEKIDIIKTYDLMKAEKECSLMSLECCKEEKQELEASLLKCNQERSKIATELALTKKFVENSRSHLNTLSKTNGVLQNTLCPSDELRISHISTEDVNMNYRTSPLDPNSTLVNDRESESAFSLRHEEPQNLQAVRNVNPEKEGLQVGGENGIQEDLEQNAQKHVSLAKDLKSSLDHLNAELERMKNENLLLPVDDNDYDPCPGLQRELMRLNEANEELRSRFPLFNDISVSGNSLERVLALELELAEALQAKKKSSIQFQSSFLKQHNDEEAIFQSFRVINELIKDMLELKVRHASVENELREMHDRYSQLSLEFAEVEGERQKLMMTLKNVRASRKATSLGDQPL